MIRGLLILGVVLTGLVLWDRAITGEREAARAESAKLRDLIPLDERDGMVVAAIRVETPQGENLVYARSRGTWRLIEPSVNTYADVHALDALMQAVVDAEGVVLTEEKLRAKSYGFGKDLSIRVTLHGPQLRSAEDQDVLYSVDLGYPIQGTGGCYVRPFGTTEIWAIDTNPRDALARPPGSSFPPMLDPYVIPTGANAVYQGFLRVAVEQRSGDSYTLDARVRDPEEVQEGEEAIEWTIRFPNGTSEPCHAVPVTGYTLFLMRTPYEKILGVSELDPSVVESPWARLEIQPAVGEPFQLLVGEPERTGGAIVVNTGTQTIFGVSKEVLELLLPTADQVSKLSEGNPWHDYIQVNPLAGTPMTGVLGQ